MLKTWRNRLKIKNNSRFVSNTKGIILLHSMFDVLTINGNLYWKRGRIDLKSKRLNSFLVNNSNLKKICPKTKFIEENSRLKVHLIIQFKISRTLKVRIIYEQWVWYTYTYVNLYIILIAFIWRFVTFSFLPARGLIKRLWGKSFLQLTVIFCDKSIAI